MLLYVCTYIVGVAADVDGGVGGVGYAVCSGGGDSVVCGGADVITGVAIGNVIVMCWVGMVGAYDDVVWWLRI